MGHFEFADKKTKLQTGTENFCQIKFMISSYQWVFSVVGCSAFNFWMNAYIESRQLIKKNSLNQQICILILIILLIHTIKNLFLLRN